MIHSWANPHFRWNPAWWVKELFHGRRAYWALRAQALGLRNQPWRVGRTDLVSYDAKMNIVEHFAYGPGDQYKQFVGESALRSAVRYAEKMNRDYTTEASGAYHVAVCPACNNAHANLMFFKLRTPREGATVWARCPRSSDMFFELIETCHAHLMRAENKEDGDDSLS